MRDWLKVGLIALVVVIIAGSSYVAGFGTHWFILQVQQQRQAAVGPVAPTPAGQTSAGQPAQFKVFWEAWTILQRDFYGPVPDNQQMTYGAIRGVLQTLDDPNTLLFDPQQTRLQESDLSGRFEGIGAVVSMNEDGELVIVTPMAGQPAEKAGLRAGDIILKVDDKEVKGLSLTEAVLLIRGPRGTKVRLTVFRLGEPSNLEFEVTRGEIETQTVSWRILDQAPEVGYVRLLLFGERTTQELKTALNDLKRKGARSLIVDLRNNPGGRLDSAILVTSQFVKNGAVVYQHWTDGREKEYRAEPGGLATDIPMVLLINKGSASASEILAGAVKYYKRATLVGEKTFGKGTVQNIYPLSDGSTLHVTTAQWLTPDKHQIDGEGVAPDIEVVLSDADIQARRDVQLERAVQFLQGGS
jgi:carboxyl-terminal processing protease